VALLLRVALLLVTRLHLLRLLLMLLPQLLTLLSVGRALFLLLLAGVQLRALRGVTRVQCGPLLRVPCGHIR
jgi:hypothetical protein